MTVPNVKPLLYTCLAAVLISCNPVAPEDSTQTFPPTNQMREEGPSEDYEDLLRRRVNREGRVHYAGIRRENEALDAYLKYLEKQFPLLAEAPENSQMAFWINYFNASVLKLIVQHYPIASVYDIGRKASPSEKPDYDRLDRTHPNHPFDVPIGRIEGKKLTLHTVRDSIIRGIFRDPRMLFTLADGTASSARLRRNTYTAENIGAELDAAASDFFRNPEKNVLNPQNPKLSSLLQRYAEDFGGDESAIVTFVNAFIPITIRPDARIEYLPFDGSLNGY